MVRKKNSAKRVYVVEKNGQLKMVPLFFGYEGGDS